MPLGMASVGDVNTIKKITGRDDVRQHLAELGLVVAGEPITVITEMNGSVIVSIRHSRVALGREMTENIMIREIRQ